MIPGSSLLTCRKAFARLRPGNTINFKRAFGRYYSLATGYAVMLKRLASAVAMFRNNLQHGEKARRPRDYEIADVFRPVLDETVELVLDYPSRRLATYGTLAEDKTFAGITGIVPARSTATVRGVLRDHGRYKVFCHGPQTAIDVSLASFTPERLTYAKLDDYEGRAYRRVLTPATADSRTVVCNIYLGHVDAGLR